MSYFSNASAFLAVGKRFSLDVQIRLKTGFYHLAIDDCHSIESLIGHFDRHEVQLRAAIVEGLRTPKGYSDATPNSREAAWKYVLQHLFDYHEFHVVERFAALASLVHMINQEDESVSL